MKAINHLLYFFLFVSLLASCEKKLSKVDFTMNGDRLQAIEDLPSDPSDDELVLNINLGDSVIFRDVSAPAAAVKSRKWDFNSDREWDVVDQGYFSYAFNEAGFYKVVFCVNGETNCIAKAIYVGDFADNYTGEPNAGGEPQLYFTNPPSATLETDKKRYQFTINTENIQSADELTVSINGQNINRFHFDAQNGLLSFSKSLRKGKNTVEVSAANEAGYSNEMVIVYRGKIQEEESGGGTAVVSTEPATSYPPTSSTPAVSTPKEVLQPIVQMLKPASASSTTIQNETIEFKADHILRKSQLTVKVNGEVISNYNYSNPRGRWIGKVFLKEGNNRIEVIADNTAGRSQDFIDINYSAPTVAIAPVVETPTRVTPTEPITPTIVPTPPERPKIEVDPKPKPKEREKVLRNSCVSGIPLSKHAGFSKDCIALYTKDTYIIKLMPKQKVELISFYVFTNRCGGVEVTLSGDGDTQKFKSALNAGKSLLLFNNIDALLTAGESYTLTLQPIGDYRGCPGKAAPSFEKITDCNMAQKNCAAISLDQNNNPILYDLKLLY